MQVLAIIITIPVKFLTSHQLEDEEDEEESYLVPSLLTDQLTIDDAVRPYDLVYDFTNFDKPIVFCKKKRKKQSIAGVLPELHPISP